MRLAICLLVTTLISIAPYMQQSASADVLQRKETTLLPSVPDTPYLPTYTGVRPRFEKAFKTVHKKDGLVSLEIYMMAKEQPDQVANWYRSVFRQYGWAVDGFDPCSESVSATRLTQGNQCTVHVSADDDEGYRTRVVISYQIFKPVLDEDDAPKPQTTTIAGNKNVQAH